MSLISQQYYISIINNIKKTQSAETTIYFHHLVMKLGKVDILFILIILIIIIIVMFILLGCSKTVSDLERDRIITKNTK